MKCFSGRLVHAADQEEAPPLSGSLELAQIGSAAAPELAVVVPVRARNMEDPTQATQPTKLEHGTRP